MRHGKKINHLGRTSAHRKAMLSNMASSLIAHKRITTTVAKAKALRKYVEPLLTKAKSDTTHNRRVVFSYLQDKESVTTLFNDVAGKIASRPGGYTRIIKLGNRLGDNADMALIELVDYNETYSRSETAAATKKTRRSRRGGGKAKAAPEVEETITDVTEVEEVTASAEEQVEDTTAAEDTDAAGEDAEEKKED